ncbi:unnamed protein product [Mytilus coruscus]|uniref:B box-type domain-containing protein n=1 Tax=Mytilus coruscus TaxID=42192 RepID=A0A6J8EES9_MYTCO|nr:unnamed protein product [Mytilus coruscus]
MQDKDVFSNNMCTPCMFRNEQVTPVGWCIVCNEGLCKYCMHYHRSSKTLKRHDIVRFKDRQSIPVFAQSVQENCSQHERNFDFFCCVHQEFYCIKCSTLDHKTCDSVLPLEDVLRNAKSSVAFCHIEEGLNVLLSKIETILNKLGESIGFNDTQANEIKTDINEIRIQICKKLDEDIGEFLRTLDNLKSESKIKAHETIQKLKEKRNVIQDLKANVALLRKNGTKLQVCLCQKHLESNLSQEENNLTTSIENGQYDSLEIVFHPGDITKTLSLMGNIGEIEVKQKPLKVNSGGMGQSVKVVKSLKEFTLYRTDEALKKYWSYLAVVARLCLIVVFLLDCIVSFEQFLVSYHGVKILLTVSIFGQIAGCVMVLLRRKTKVGAISLCGIVLMAYADDTGEKSLFASTSSSLSDVNWKAKFTGKILNESMEPICWCMDCKEGLCVYYSNHHRSSKALKRHDLVTFKDRRSIPEFAQSVQETCFEHERSFDFFCCDHQEYHCIKCSTLDHKTCNSVLLLEDVVRNAKSSVAFCHIEKGLNVLLSKIETILNKSREAIGNINVQVNEISNNVNEIRTQIHKKLEEDIGEFLRKLDELKSESKTKAHETIRGLKEKLNVIQDLKARRGTFERKRNRITSIFISKTLGIKLIKRRKQFNNKHRKWSRKIKIGCLILSLVKVSQIYLLSKDDETPFFRAISICGIVLMAYADVPGGKSLFASSSSSFFAGNWKSKMTGKILLLWMYFPLLIENIETPGWIRLTVGLCLIVSNTIGYRINVSAVLIIVWLLLGNYSFIDKRRTLYDSDFSSYTYLMNTMMIIGGYLLMISYGSENTDIKKKT